MTTAELQGEPEVSIISIATMLLRHRWRLLKWASVGVAVAATLAFLRAPQYVASASFVPQGTDAGRSGLATLAGQFGLSLPPSNQMLSPDFYSRLLESRVLLRQIARDTFTVPELGGKRVSFLELFRIEDGSAASREELGVKVLEDIVSTSVVKSTGVVQLAVRTRWPSVSLAVATGLVDGVDDFNQRTRQGQAAAERKFVEGRLAVSAAQLRAAEDRLQAFLQNNRDMGRSPELTFERDRLQREVSLQQQVFTSLTQGLEEARIREVRDTPVITVIESPWVAAMPEPRGRLRLLLLGLFFGLSAGAASAFASETVARGRDNGNVETEKFVDTLSQARGEILGPVSWVKKKFRR